MAGDTTSPLFLEAVFEAMTDGVLVSDDRGNIIQANAAMIKLLHLDAFPHFLRLPFYERLALLKAVDEHGQILRPEDWPLARVLRGETLGGGREEDMHLFLPDGADIYVNHTGACIHDAQGKIIGAVLIIHNVNERHLQESRSLHAFKTLLALAEELVDLPVQIAGPHPIAPQNGEEEPPFHAFRTAGEHLAELTSQMLDYRVVSVALIDQQTGLMRLVAMAGEDPQLQTWYYRHFAATDPAELLTPDALAHLNRNEVIVETLTLHYRDPRPFNALLAPMLLDGRLSGMLIIEKEERMATYSSEEFELVKAIAQLILLVIDRERMQREWLEIHASELALREANRRFDEFLSIASHELRTPLTGIKGNLQLARRRLKALQTDKTPDLHTWPEKLDRVQEYLLQAEHRVNVQNRMISDLLDVSRIQANKLELVLAPCDLLQIVREAVKDQQYNVPERLITLSQHGNGSAIVRGDADRLGQVVHNYLTNALKYSPPHSPVAAQIDCQNGQVRVAVRDLGPGLSPEEQQHVWERFYRVKDIPAIGSGQGQGLGLGLHICRTIITAHGGSFGLESAPGQGSTFWFTLPLASTPQEPAGPLSSILSERAPESEAPHA